MRFLGVSIPLALIILCTHSADAYPQYQLSHDTTCTSCHLSPAGGGLLNENGYTVSESEAWKPGDSSFFYGKVDVPGWLQVGGDIRAQRVPSTTAPSMAPDIRCRPRFMHPRASAASR
jgi:hypothetical protein